MEELRFSKKQQQTAMHSRFSQGHPMTVFCEKSVSWAEIRDSQRSICGLMPVFEFLPLFSV